MGLFWDIFSPLINQLVAFGCWLFAFSISGAAVLNG